MVVWEATECCQYHSCNVYFSFSCCHPHDYDDDHDDNDHHRLKNTTAECFDFHFSGHLRVGHFNTRFSSPLPTMSRFPKSGKITKHLTSEKFSLFTFTFLERRSRPFSHFHIFLDALASLESTVVGQSVSEWAAISPRSQCSPVNQVWSI